MKEKLLITAALLVLNLVVLRPVLGQGFVFPDEEEEEEEEPVQNPRKAESLQEAPGLGGASANSFDGRGDFA